MFGWAVSDIFGSKYVALVVAVERNHNLYLNLAHVLPFWWARDRNPAVCGGGAGEVCVNTVAVNCAWRASKLHSIFATFCFRVALATFIACSSELLVCNSSDSS